MLIFAKLYAMPEVKQMRYCAVVAALFV